jgi:hypothetical protein
MCLVAIDFAFVLMNLIQFPESPFEIHVQRVDSAIAHMVFISDLV